MTTLGRASSFRIAYQAALHDLAQVTAERDAAEAEVERLRVFVAANGDNQWFDGIDTNYFSCNGCSVPSVKRRASDNRPVRLKHAPGCIVAEARQAQKEVAQ